MNRSAFIAPPPVLDPAILREPERSILGAWVGLNVLVTYDPTRLVGGIYIPLSRSWLVIGPMPLGDYLSTLGGMGVVIAPSDDFDKWILAASTTTHPGRGVN